MKKLHKLVLKSFLGPLFLTFFLVIFILLMQFLWKYVDDLVGKGLEFYVIAKLMFYASASLVPMALPLAILLSSIMAFGNLSEHYELVALKAAGISLRKIMAPVIYVTILISIAAFFFSNYALPYSNLKMGSLLYDIRQQKPAFNIKEGIFYNGIQNFSIRVVKKEEDNQTLKGIMIYNHLENNGNTEIILSDNGKMNFLDNGNTLKLLLNNGSSYAEPKKSQKAREENPLYRSSFEKKIILFDLSSFNLNRTDENLFKSNYQMLNIKQLTNKQDTLKILFDLEVKYFNSSITSSFPNLPLYRKGAEKFNRNNFLTKFENNEREYILTAASNSIRNLKSTSTVNVENFYYHLKTIREHKIEWHRKFTLSFACLVLLFIGAPLGALIKKGGLGLPMVISIILFIIYHVISISGEKAAKIGEMEIYNGMWLASFCMIPLGLYFTYRASKDLPIIGSVFTDSITFLFKKKNK